MSTSKQVIVHRSKFFQSVAAGGVNTIMTHNVLGNFQDIKALEAAVHRLADRNPILSGTFNQVNGLLVVDTERARDRLVQEIPTPATMPKLPQDKNDGSAMMTYVQTHIDPHIPRPTKGDKEISKKMPTFALRYMKLPDNYLYFAFCMSHVIGDGSTYYMLLEEFNAILTLKTPVPYLIRWETEVGTTFNFTHQTSSPLMFLSMIASLVIYKLFGLPETGFTFLSKAKIGKKKKELLPSPKDGIEYLTTNDIVTAALAEQSYLNYQVCLHSVDYRKHNRWPNVQSRDGGNISRILAMNLATDGRDALGVRRFAASIPSMLFKNLPFWPIFRGLLYNQTNWASLHRVVDGTVFHSPFREVVAKNDIPIVVIFQPNEDEIGISYMLTGINPQAGLLGELATDT